MNRQTLQQTGQIQNIIREYFKNMYSTKLKNSKEIDEFLESTKPPKLNHEINNLNRPITNDEIEVETKSFN